MNKVGKQAEMFEDKVLLRIRGHRSLVVLAVGENTIKTLV